MVSPRQVIDLRAEVLDAKLLSFLAAYAANGRGSCPGLGAIASELGVPEEEARRVIGRCEERGLIHVISRKPLRIMLCDGRASDKADMKAMRADPKRFDRFLDAEGQRHRLGRFVGQFEKENGRGPSLRECMDFVGYQSPSYVDHMLRLLARLGLIQHGNDIPTKLTAEGRLYYEGKKEMEQKKEKRKLVFVMKDRKPAAVRVNDLCNALANAIRRDGTAGNFRHFRLLAEDLGYAPGYGGCIGKIANAAIKDGYLQPRRKKQHGLFFTEKGLAKFLPEAVEKEPEFAEVDEAEQSSDGYGFAQTAEAIQAEISAMRAAANDYAKPAQPHFQPATPGTIAEVSYGAPAPQPVSLANVDSALLAMELIERGYIVKKG